MTVVSAIFAPECIATSSPGVPDGKENAGDGPALIREKNDFRYATELEAPANVGARVIERISPSEL
jgi:hypothetical protein